MTTLRMTFSFTHTKFPYMCILNQVTFKNKEESKDFWKAYNKYADNHRAKVYNTGSDTIQKLIAQRVERGQSLNASAVTRMINKYIKSQKEELERIEREEFTAISETNFLSFSKKTTPDKSKYIKPPF